ncbi:MAG: class I SAM-dependent methyltransferase, partial [Actinomycetota bacterium]|nr:class I SAM-dependent methyltransferase [Actinomycetota bacterium]
TGRVALELARVGHAVTALDSNAGLLRALRGRAAGLPVATALADARDFALDQCFALCLAPMQTAQLLGGPEGRARFLRCARRHVRGGGTLAAALAGPLEAFDAEADAAHLPRPDRDEHEGWVYSSQPVAIRRRPGTVEIHRVRRTIGPDGARGEARDVVCLDELCAADLEREGMAAGFTPLPRRNISPSRDHVGSTVVMLRG